MNETKKAYPVDCFKFGAYTLPLGSEFVLGKRRWRLMHRDPGHPDHMCFRESSAAASTPDRVMNPSEVDALYDLGVEFMVPIRKAWCELRPVAFARGDATRTEITLEDIG